MLSSTFRMELLLQKIKLGIIKGCSVEPLLACENKMLLRDEEMSEVPPVGVLVGEFSLCVSILFYSLRGVQHFKMQV